MWETIDLIHGASPRKSSVKIPDNVSNLLVVQNVSRKNTLKVYSEKKNKVINGKIITGFRIIKI